MSRDAKLIAWPPERFYWSLVDVDVPVDARGRPKGGRDALLAAIEPDLPVPLDSVHAAFARVVLADGSRRFLACAAARDDLASIAAAALSLTPSALPEFVAKALGEERDQASASGDNHSHSGQHEGQHAASTHTPDSEGPLVLATLELLTRPFEPPVLVASRRRRQWIALASCVALSGVGSLGLLRRAAHDRDLTSAHAKASVEIQDRLGLSPLDAPGDLASRVAALDAMAKARSSLPATPDAATTLAWFLARWATTDPAAKPNLDQLSVTPTGVNAALSLQGPPEPFLQSLAGPTAPQTPLVLDQPRVTQLPNATQVSLTLRRRPAPKGAPGGAP